MTDKELRKLSRSELLTLLIEVTEENERLSAILARRELQQDGENASAAADGVTEDVQGVFQSLESTAVGFLKEAREISDQIILEAQERADQMIAEARQQAGQIAGTSAFGAPVQPDADDTELSDEEDTATQGQTDAVFEAVGEVRPPDPDALELPWREHGAEEAEEVEEPAEAEAETVTEFEEAEAEIPEAEAGAEEEPEAASEDEGFELPWLKKKHTEEAEVPGEPFFAEDAEEVSGDTEDTEEVSSSDDLKPLTYAEEVQAEAIPEQPADVQAEAVTEPAEDVQAEAIPEQAADVQAEETPEPEETPAPEEAPQKPLTAIDMLRMMQGGGR